MAQLLTHAEINALNTSAREMYEDNHVGDDDENISLDVSIALCMAAENAELEEIFSDDQTIIYADKNGRLVNCWLFGQSSALIEDGGAGFDNQVAWYTDAELEDD